MGLLSLNFNVTQKQLVNGLTDDGVFLLPELHQEDSPTIDLQAFKRENFNSPGPAFSRVSLAGYALQISIGSANSILASQNTWTLSADTYTLSAALPLNTAGINALADLTQQIFEARLSDGANFYRLQAPVIIRKSVALADTLSDPATGTPISREEANLVFMKLNGVSSVPLIDTVTGVLHLLQVQDGVLIAPPVT